MASSDLCEKVSFLFPEEGPDISVNRGFAGGPGLPPGLEAGTQMGVMAILVHETCETPAAIRKGIALCFSMIVPREASALPKPGHDGVAG